MTGAAALLLVCCLISAFLAWTADVDGKDRQRDVLVGVAMLFGVLSLIFNN